MSHYQPILPSIDIFISLPHSLTEENKDVGQIIHNEVEKYIACHIKNLYSSFEPSAKVRKLLTEKNKKEIVKFTENNEYFVLNSIDMIGLYFSSIDLGYERSKGSNNHLSDELKKKL